MHSQDRPKDSLFAYPIEQIGKFAFDESVAEVFDNMIRRSVPGYGMTLSMMPLIAKRYGKPGTRVYDLGCSTGAGLVSVAKGLPHSAQLIGIDSSQPMLERCSENLASAQLEQKWELVCSDILETDFSQGSIALLNFTLQFVPVAQRLGLLGRIAQGLNSGGALLLSEKVGFDDSRVQDTLFEMHHDFKRANGYSDMEVSQKRAALEDVLITETIDIHKTRLREAGFDYCETWLQCFNFVSLLAIKA